MVRSSRQNKYFKTTLAAFLAVAFSGCSGDEQIATYEESDSERSVGVKSPVQRKTAPAAAMMPNLKYDTPEGWISGSVGGMRKAAFRVTKDDRTVEITVIDLTPRAAALLPNVNRWRLQVQLGEITQEELNKSVEDIPFGGVQGQYVEMFGPEDAETRHAILGVVAVRGGRAWFAKLRGDVELAKEEKQRFQEFVKSIKFELPSSDRGHMAAKDRSQGAAVASGPLKFSAPDGWATGKAGSMRKAAFQVTEGKQTVEITAIDLSVEAGGLLANVNRWREQIKLEKITQEELASSLKSIQIADEEAKLVELMGPKDADRPLAILGVVAQRLNRTWFFKMIGDADLVVREKGRFEEFVKSVTFAADGGDDD